MSALTHGGLFSGIGGFSLGFRRAGVPTRWEVEIDPACRAVLRRHNPDATILDDVREVGAHNLTPVDVITFGSPCQDLSVAGRRAGFDGARSVLFFEATRIIRELRPTYAVWENVPGALSSHAGRDFGAVLDALAECGAVDICWRMLDAQYFGLAQRRLRLFLVASFRAGASAAQVLLEPESGGGHPPPRREAGQDIAYCLAAGAGGSKFGSGRQGQDTFIPSVAATLRVPSNGAAWRGDGCDNFIAFSNRGIDADTHETLLAASHGALPMVAYQCQGTNVGEMGTLRSGNGHVTGGVPFIAAHSIAVRGREDGQEWELGDPEIGNALRAGDGGSSRGNWALTPQMAVRRLTPTECERLQGFPDDWTAHGDDGKPISDSSRYRMLGNAAPVPVAEWIGRRILEAN